MYSKVGFGADRSCKSFNLPLAFSTHRPDSGNNPEQCKIEADKTGLVVGPWYTKRAITHMSITNADHLEEARQLAAHLVDQQDRKEQVKQYKREELPDSNRDTASTEIFDDLSL
jgi:hypothetical protein